MACLSVVHGYEDAQGDQGLPAARTPRRALPKLGSAYICDNNVIMG